MSKPSVDDQIAALIAKRDEEKKALVEEARGILADPELRAKIDRLAEIAADLPTDAGRYKRLRLPLLNLTRDYGHAANVCEGVVADDAG